MIMRGQLILPVVVSVDRMQGSGIVRSIPDPGRGVLHGLDHTKRSVAVRMEFYGGESGQMVHLPH